MMGSRIRENVNEVFQCFCEIISPKPSNSAQIIDRFPESFQEEETLNSILKFTYPCEFEQTSIQHYSFVLTNEDSKWTFGFCRYDPKTDTALVFLSSLPWHDTFYKLLNNISEVRYSLNPVEQRKLFLEALYICDIPTNGNLIIPWDEFTFVCRCPLTSDLPKIPENRNITEYYSAADPHNMTAIFASLLHERRVVFVSRRLPRLSACVQAAAALLYPMHWQHVFIPILPQPLVDYVLAPMPFLIGAPLNVFEIVNKNEIADVVVFDADKNTLQSPFDDLNNLPSEVINGLRRELRTQSMLGDGVSRAFLRTLVSLIGGYRDALRMHPGEPIVFQEEAFLQSRPPAIQPFLQKILHLQIFQQFIEERLSLLNGGLGFSDEFEKEICQHTGKSSSRFRQQYKKWKHAFRKEGTSFFKAVRNKVQDHGKDVRAACKDIKSRLKERGDSSSPSKSRPRNGSTSSQRQSRAHTYIKATTSYKRPLTVQKMRTTSDVESLPITDHKLCDRLYNSFASHDQVSAPASLSYEGGVLLEDTPSMGSRTSDGERLLAEYGLNFGALSLHSTEDNNCLDDDVPSSNSVPPTMTPLSSPLPSPPLSSPPPSPPTSSPPPLTPPPVRPAR